MALARERAGRPHQRQQQQQPHNARVAQSAERKTLNLVVVGSSPTSGARGDSRRRSNTRCCKMSRVQIPASPDPLWGCSSGAECLLRSVRRPRRHAFLPGPRVREGSATERRLASALPMSRGGAGEPSCCRSRAPNAGDCTFSPRRGRRALCSGGSSPPGDRLRECGVSPVASPEANNLRRGAGSKGLVFTPEMHEQAKRATPCEDSAESGVSRARMV